ncbi:MAG: hypothetical protein JSR58_07270 [Verrucomicrobia bacterium]|nr:hypothetical protein [Verrucomicrobiota bacterium]
MNKLFLFIWLYLLTLPLPALELKRVILSTNNNPNYIEFWPVVAPIWTAIGIRPTLALIADEHCPVDTSIGDVIRFPPLPDIPESLQAQVIRLFLPIMYPDEGCLISDIDMIPISRTYFIEGAKHCPDTGFLVYRDKGAIGDESVRYPMCYNAAKGSVFGSLFGISHPDEIPQMIELWASAGLGWNTDELLLHAHIMQWERNGGLVIRLGHGVEGRLDRGNWNIDFDHLDVSQYIDCHCPRPYSKYKDSIDRIVQEIYKQL